MENTNTIEVDTIDYIDYIGWGRWFKRVAFLNYNNDDVIKFLEMFDKLWLKTRYVYMVNYKKYKKNIDELYEKLLKESWINEKTIRLTYEYFMVYTYNALEVTKEDLKYCY